MAITRSQIARQLLAAGGVSLDDAKMMAPPGEFLAYINPKEADMLKAAGGSGIMTPMGIPSFTEDEEDTGDVSNPGGSGDFGSGEDDSYGEDFQGSAFGSNRGDMGSPPGGDADNIDFSNVTARDLFKASASNPLLYRSGGERAALASFPVFGPLITAGEQFAYDLPMFQYSRTGPNFKDRFVDDGDDNDRDWETC